MSEYLFGCVDHGGYDPIAAPTCPECLRAARHDLARYLVVAADLATENEQLRSAARFGMHVLRESRDELADLDGGWIQDTAEACGLLTRVTVTESCGEDCRCAEYYGEFPCECLRYAPSVLQL